MAKYVTKGLRGLLRKLHIRNQNNKTIQIHTNREGMENAVIEFNRIQYQKSHNTNMHRDKIHNKLKENYIGNKVLNRVLEHKDYNNEDIFKLLKLFK